MLYAFRTPLHANPSLMRGSNRRLLNNRPLTLDRLAKLPELFLRANRDVVRLKPLPRLASVSRTSMDTSDHNDFVARPSVRYHSVERVVHVVV